MSQGRPLPFARARAIDRARDEWRSMAGHKIGIIGLGRITEDQHLPVIARCPAFELTAVSSRRSVEVAGVPTFRTPAEMYAAVPELDTVAVCTPPQVDAAPLRLVADSFRIGRRIATDPFYD